jgi:EF hand
MKIKRIRKILHRMMRTMASDLTNKKMKGKIMKMKTMMAMLALGASALAVNAQDAGGPPPDDQRPPPQDGNGGSPGMNGHRPPPSPLFLALDVNRDGVLESNEIANASNELLTLDKNGDGKLTQDELRPPRPPRMDSSADGNTNSPPHWDGPGGHDANGHRPLPPLMQALDVNHDGVLDADEIANAPAALKTLDKNGDGKLTQDELRPPRPQDGGSDSGNDRPPGPPPSDQ